MRFMFLLVHLTPQVPWSNEEVGSGRFCTYSGYVSQLNDLSLVNPNLLFVSVYLHVYLFI